MFNHYKQIQNGPGGPGHCRVGWAMDRVPYEDMDGPVGYAAFADECGFSYSVSGVLFVCLLICVVCVQGVLCFVCLLCCFV